MGDRQIRLIWAVTGPPELDLAAPISADIASAAGGASIDLSHAPRSGVRACLDRERCVPDREGAPPIQFGEARLATRGRS